MNAQPQPTPIRSLDDDVAEYLELTERIEQLTSQRAAITARLAERGLGKHPTTSGLTVTVTPPNRTFNADRAWNMLTPEQQALCVAPVAAKIKAQLSAVLVEACMEDGTGANRVSVK